MLTTQLGNCPKCGMLFLRKRELCDQCYQKQEDDYLKAAAYLRENPGSTMQELSDETKVSVGQIRQFILTKRILVGNFPNLAYPCKMCGGMINTGSICVKCVDTFNKLDNRDGKEGKKNSQEPNEITGGYISKYL